jgi:hypothetical protein
MKGFFKSSKVLMVLGMSPSSHVSGGRFQCHWEVDYIHVIGASGDFNGGGVAT